MGPSVKFVLPIIDAFPDKKNGGNFLCGKKGQTGGGGPEGGLVFRTHFFPSQFFERLPNKCDKMPALCCKTCLSYSAIYAPKTFIAVPQR